VRTAFTESRAGENTSLQTTLFEALAIKISFNHSPDINRGAHLIKID